MKLITWFKEWLEVYKKPYIKTYKNIERVIRLHIPETLKNKELKTISPLEIQKNINSCNYGRTRLELFDVYHGALTMAYRLGLLEKDLAPLLIKPKHIRVMGEPLSAEELDEFYKAIEKTRYHNAYMFYFLSGCRRSEALTLTENDVNFKENLLHIRGTKTAESDRYIPLFPELKTLLENTKTKNGRYFPFNANRLSRTFKALCPAHKLHDLRHTFATRCLECGISIKVVQKWLGHTRLDTTANIYSHAQADFILSEAEKFHLK